MRSPRPVTVVALLALSIAACGGHLQTFPRALGDWRAGRYPEAIGAARDEVERWREGNDLDEPAVDEALASVQAILDDDIPLVVSGEVAPREAGAARVDLDRQLQADLLSNRATVVVRALQSVEKLGLVRHGPALLTVIFRREPVASDDGLLAKASPALRSVVTKRLALRALEALAAPNPPML